MKVKKKHTNRKTEALNIRLHGEIKELLELMAEETDEKTVTAVIEGVASAYKNRAYCPGEWTKVPGKNIYVRKEKDE